MHQRSKFGYLRSVLKPAMLTIYGPLPHAFLYLVEIVKTVAPPAPNGDRPSQADASISPCRSAWGTGNWQ